ncbi:MAG: transcription termination/antitermination protein NusA [Chloroflexi bacterium]|nr:transcription termination/antitermination protein NusA [Chloroflexota bacterium]
MKSDFLAAINQISSEKGLSAEVVIQAIEAALVSAYKRNFSNATNLNVDVRLNRQSGEVKVFTQRTVVDEVNDPRVEISLAEAAKLRPDATVGNVIEEETTPQNFGRIAAQTAKQVVVQRLREAERDLVYQEFTGREGEIVTGVVQRIEPKGVIVDLGKAEATMPAAEQVPGETYRPPSQRLKVYVVEVHRTPKGPQIVVSRTHRNLVRRLFELEVPEIYNGTVEIKSIAREPGSRSKVAVAARQEGVDPVGSCVGLRGVRIQNIVNELHGEKIDVIEWHSDPAHFVAKALSPAQVVSVQLNEAEKTALVLVPERQLSLAIGREGQNARLAARLTGWRIDIKPATLAKLDAHSDHSLEATGSVELGGSAERRG